MGFFQSLINYQARCKRSGLGFVFLLAVQFSCKKENAIAVEPEPNPPKTPKVSFVFVNRNGFRNDSLSIGSTYNVFQGPCIDARYFDKKANITHFDNTCYNRNFAINNFPVTDSLLFREFESSINSRYGMLVELRWWNYSYSDPNNKTLSKKLIFSTINYEKGDTIKVAKDTVIKFIWPLDTNSGRFIKTYQWP